MDRSRLTQLLVFALLALVSYVIYEKYYVADSTVMYEPFTKGYSLEGVELKISNEAGEISSTIVAPSIIHYADSEVTVINEPVYTMHEDNGDWIFYSKSGEINADQTSLFFPGDVNLYLDKEEKEKIAINTSELTVNFTQKTGATNQNMALEKLGFLLTGVGAVINFTDQEVEMKKEIYAEFEN